MRIAVSAVVLGVALVGCGERDPLADLWNTELPLVDGDGAVPEDIADPGVLYVDGTWYVYPTRTKHDVEVWTSTDLREWRYRGTVWTPTPGTWAARGEVWAPTVHAVDGRYVMYVTAGYAVGVASAASPLGPFEDDLDHALLGDGHGGVGDGAWSGAFTDFGNYDEFSIDPFLLQAADGSLVLYATRYTPLSTLIAVPMADPTTPSGPPVTLATPNGDSWEGAVLEGPWVVEQGGRVVLMYSGNFFDTVAYGLGAMVADDPLGPFERLPGNPFAATDDAAGFWAPGHHGLAPGPDGQTLIFYHAKTTPEPGAADRRVRLGRLVFDDVTPALDPPAP